ncbi:MAG: aldo/keto reductase [Ignavibacteriaceae bacterium]
MSLSISDRTELNNGIKIPNMGFGTYNLIPDSKAKEAVLTALEAGYRHIDTASSYGNEKGVGDAARESGIQRNEIFITTKVANDDQGYELTYHAFETSLANLKTDYIDLYLIHWPVTGLRSDTWKALTELVQFKTCKAIGVSNYTIRHLKELFRESDIRPVVNQVEFNPFIYQQELLDFCYENNIQLEAYTPLARNHKADHPLFGELSKKYSKSPAQIMIRWCLQHKVVVIPKSGDRKRIYENADVFDFDISGEDMQRLNKLNEGYRASMDPEEFK